MIPWNFNTANDLFLFRSHSAGRPTKFSPDGNTAAPLASPTSSAEHRAPDVTKILNCQRTSPPPIFEHTPPAECSKHISLRWGGHARLSVGAFVRPAVASTNKRQAKTAGGLSPQYPPRRTPSRVSCASSGRARCIRWGRPTRVTQLVLPDTYLATTAARARLRQRGFVAPAGSRNACRYHAAVYKTAA